MIVSAYQTTACRNYRLKDLKDAVIRAQSRGELQTFDYFYGVTGQSDDCPLFTQLLTTQELGSLINLPVADIRSYSQLSGRGDDVDVIITQKVAIEELNQRAHMQIEWERGRATDFSNLGELPVRCFMQYLGRSIATRLGLDPKAELECMAIVGYYYYCLFEHEDEFDQDARAKAMYRTSKVAMLDVAQLEVLLGNTGYIQDLSGLIAALQSAIDSPRVKQLNIATLFSLIGGGWFGQHARETVCVAMEHPPTWIWIMHRAVTNQSYRRTLITKVVQQNDRKGSGQAFVKSLAFLLRG